MALIIVTKSGFNDAPPTKNPSISGQVANSLQFEALTEPPYKILKFSDTSADTFSANHLRKEA